MDASAAASLDDSKKKIMHVLLVTCEHMYQHQRYHPLATLAQLYEDVKLAGQPHQDSFSPTND